MSYLGDIRENSIGPNGELWEGDNRIEKRHYWNGAYIDLCNLPGEEYSKTIFVTNGSGSGSGSDSNTGDTTPTIQTKAMSLEIVNGDAVVMFAGTAASDMYVAISYNGVEQYTLKIEKGTSGASGIQFGLGGVTSIEKYGIGGSEIDALAGKKTYQDEEFKYQITFNAPVVFPVAYQIAAMKGHIDTMTDEEVLESISVIDSITMESESTSETFVADIKPIAIEGLAEMSPAEITEVLLNNAQDIIIITDREVVDILAASTNDSVIEGWNKRGHDAIIDGVAYHVWYKTANDTELSAVYDPAVPEAAIDIPEDSITYIIKYA